MPHEVVLGKVYDAIKALLSAHSPLTALIATKAIGGAPAVYDEGEPAVQGAKVPYVTVGAGTQVPFHTLGMVTMPRFGWNCTIQVKAVSQGSESAGLAILSQVAAVLYDGRALSLPGYGSAFTTEFTVQSTLIEQIAGVTTRSSPAIVRVMCHD